MELNERGLSLFTLFESITSVMPRDYAEAEETIIFLVDPFQLGRSIGKNGVNVDKLKTKINKRVFVVADSDDPSTFIRNFFSNLKILAIEERNVMNERSFLVYFDEKERGLAIGKNGERIKILKEFLKKKFNATAHVRTRRVLGESSSAEVAESG